MFMTHRISELSKSMNGKEVTLCGWVHEIRELGKLKFLLLRDSTGIVQITGKRGVTDDETYRAMSLPKESVVQVTGTVSENREARLGFEIVPKRIVNLNPLSTNIPFEVTGKVDAELDVRLNYRYIDLRRTESAAVFKIESTLANTFIEECMRREFVHIRTPSIVAETTEGGADLFSIDYFGRKAYLAQSPQLYKQLAVIGGLGTVFTITPVFRAEKSNTVYHINESTQMDIEMAFADHDDVITVLSEIFTAMLKAVKEKNVRDLELLNVNLEVPKVKVVTYTEAVDALNDNDVKMVFGEDFAREHEKALCRIYGDAVIVKEYPSAVRAFYSMPKEGDERLCNSFDLLYKGLEILSGAQRIHLPEVLIKSLKSKGLDPKEFEPYVNAMRCGAPPHAGWSIGLERLSMQVAGVENIREAAMFPRDRKRLTP